MWANGEPGMGIIVIFRSTGIQGWAYSVRKGQQGARDGHVCHIRADGEPGMGIIVIIGPMESQGWACALRLGLWRAHVTQKYNPMRPEYEE
jgi:hypothetical protein